MAAHIRAQHVEEITLIDADINEDFKLILNSENAKARNGNTQPFPYNSCNVRVVLQFFYLHRLFPTNENGLK